MFCSKHQLVFFIDFNLNEFLKVNQKLFFLIQNRKQNLPHTKFFFLVYKNLIKICYSFYQKCINFVAFIIGNEIRGECGMNTGKLCTTTTKNLKIFIYELFMARNYRKSRLKVYLFVFIINRHYFKRILF